MTRVISCGRGLQLASSTFRYTDTDDIELVHYLDSNFQLLPVYFSVSGSYPLEVEGVPPKQSKQGVRLRDAKYYVESKISHNFGGLDIQSSVRLVVPIREKGQFELELLPETFGGLSLPFLELKVSEDLRGVFTNLVNFDEFWSALNQQVRKGKQGER